MGVMSSKEYSIIKDGKRLNVEVLRDASIDTDPPVRVRVVETQEVLEVRFSQLQSRWTQEPQ
jgi:hypothetical protein